ncbi:hypothetical protein PFISCL1PPCAC_28420, partial [Pristionchus fissidentatus]
EPMDSPRQCRVKENKTCSPSQGNCCTEKCELHPPGHTCTDATDCATESFCLGTNATCPKPVAVNET